MIYLDYDTINNILKENEFNFCKNWSHNLVNIDNEFCTLINEDSKDDYFINRTLLVNEREFIKKGDRDISLILSKMRDTSLRLGFNLYLHVNDNFLELKKKLEDNCFKEVDKVIGLASENKDQNIPLLRNSKKHHLRTKSITNIISCRNYNDLREWISVYSSSFTIEKKQLDNLLIRILNSNFNDYRYFLYKKKIKKTNNEIAADLSIGCCLLFQFKNSLGLYCLGTDNRFRNSGIASDLVNFSIMYSKLYGFCFLGVQTLQSDNLVGIYERRNFKKTYSNTVYSI